MKKLCIGLFSILLMVSAIFTIPKQGMVHADSVFNDFSSTSYILMDKNSDTVLYSYNCNQKMPVASICKLMTTLITLESIDKGNLTLDDNIIASKYACDAEGSQAFLDEGSAYRVGDLIKSVVIASANDSAIALAEAIGGTENNFCKMMNSRAKELGMNNTLYANSTGLPAPSQYSTAYDTSIILKEINKYDIYNEYSSIWMDKLTHPSGRVTELVNTNRLIRYYDNCVCGKTGYTDEAGYCLSSVANSGDMELVAVVLNCKDSAARFKESMQLYNYGFNNFETKKVVDSTQILPLSVKVNNGKEYSVSVVPQMDYSIIDKRGNSGNVDISYELVDSINAPFDAGTYLGKVVVSKNGKVVGEVNLVTANAVDKHSYTDIIGKIIRSWAI